MLIERVNRHLSKLMVAVLLVLSLLVAALFVRHYQQTIDYHRSLSQLSVTSVANELRAFIGVQQKQAALLLMSKSEVVSAWVKSPDDPVLRSDLEKVIRAFFPESISFTMADEHGHPLWDDFGETLGELCLNDLSHRAKNSRNFSPISFIHPGPSQYHFDLFVLSPVGGEEKMLLIGFNPVLIAKKLADREVFQHHLLLTRTDANHLIEITPEGSRDKMSRPQFLSIFEQQLIEDGLGFRQPVVDTEWVLVDVLDGDFYLRQQQNLWVALSLIVFIFVFMSWFLVFLLHRYAFLIKVREAELSQSNQLLEAGVEERTRQLVDQKRQLRVAANVFSYSSHGIVITDKDNRIVDVNDAMLRWVGYSREELMGQNPRIFKSGTEGVEFYRQMWSVLLSVGHWEGEFSDFNRSQDAICMRVTINVVRDEMGAIINFIAIYSDISDLKKTQKALKDLAYYDNLTGLANRALLFDRVQSLVARHHRHGSQFALCVLDLDGFKPVNDQLGHQAGDLLLKMIADRLSAEVRECDSVARLGGDEFVVIIDDLLDKTQLMLVLDRIMGAFSSGFDLKDDVVQVGASVGVALYPTHGQDFDALVKVADKCMYRVKYGQKNGYLIAD